MCVCVWGGGGGCRGVGDGGGRGTEEGTEGGETGTLTTLGRAPTCTVPSGATDDFKTMPPSPLTYLTPTLNFSFGSKWGLLFILSMTTKKTGKH